MAVSVVILFTSLFALTIADSKCGEYGNWNPDRNACDCAFGLKGEGCKEQYLPACAPFEGSMIFQCFHHPMNCECFEQCRQHFCSGEGHCSWQPDDRLRCYTYDSGPQVSEFPAPDKKGVKYYEGFREGRRKEITYDALAKLHDRGNDRAVHLEKCKDSCNKQGYCIEFDGKATCRCHYGWEGETCSDVIRRSWGQPCINNCNEDQGWGKCFSGFCLCSEGRFGRDCTRTKTFTSGVRVLHKPRVYVYELETELVHRGPHYPGWNAHDQNYAVWEYFARQMAHDWTVRTENPYEANLFWVPLRNYDFTSNLGNPTSHTAKVIAHIRTKYPFYNQTNGRDHFIFFTNDRGPCFLPDSPFFTSFIRVSNFGFYAQNHANFREFPNKRFGCIDPLKDVVVPGNLGEFEALYNKTDWKRRGKGSKYTLFFAGALRRGDESYGGGIRVALYDYVKSLNDPRFRIHEGHAGNYIDEVRASTFCFSGYGHGWGIRIVAYMAAGCIPLTIQDNVLQPFDNILDYSEFSVTVHSRDIPNLKAILDSVTEEEIGRLQDGVARYSLLFDWGPMGLAYRATVQSIWRSFRNYEMNVSFPTYEHKHHQRRNVLSLL